MTGMAREEEAQRELAHYVDDIAADPQLRGVRSLAELHDRLAALSAELTATDPPSSAFSQLTFPSGAGSAHPAPVFRPNCFKKALSTDGVRMAAHYRYAIKDESHCVAAL